MSVNPFLASSPRQVEDLPDASDASPPFVVPKTPVPPHAGNPDLGADGPLHYVEQACEGPFVSGLHGGAGCSTVAHYLEVSCRQELGCDVVDMVSPGALPSPMSSSGVLVARVNGVGLVRAFQASQQIAAGRIESASLGLVLICDGPRPLQAARRSVQRLHQVWPTIWTLPWSPVLYASAGPVPHMPREVAIGFRHLTDHFIQGASS